MNTPDTLVSLLTALIGPYAPMSNGVTTIDYPWIFAALLFLLVMWFLFKIILAIVKGGK